MRPARAVTALTLALVLALAACSGPAEDETPSQAPTAAGQAPELPEAPETDEAEEEQHGPEGVDEAVAVSEDFVEAYNAQSYKDETPNTWVFAVEEHMTAEGYAEMTEGIDPEDGGVETSQWERGQTTQSAQVTSSDWIEGYTHSDDHVSTYVVFRLKVEDDGYPYSAQDTMYLDLLREDGKWKVHEVNHSDEVREALGGHDH